MAVTNTVKDGLEGYLYYNTDKEADYASGATGGWTLLGYVGSFNYEENPNDRPIYDHYTVDHYKKGRSANSGSISQLYTNKTATVMALKGTDFALKLEIRDDGGATVTEAHVLNKCRGGVARFSMPDQGDMTASMDFTYGTSTVSAP
jgi:hypothetical protein